MPPACLQMLGILKSMRLAWPAGVQAFMTFADQTQAVTTWWAQHVLPAGACQ
jgi:hypothetical protein